MQINYAAKTATCTVDADLFEPAKAIKALAAAGYEGSSVVGSDRPQRR